MSLWQTMCREAAGAVRSVCYDLGLFRRGRPTRRMLTAAALLTTLIAGGFGVAVAVIGAGPGTPAQRTADAPERRGDTASPVASPSRPEAEEASNGSAVTSAPPSPDASASSPSPSPSRDGRTPEQSNPPVPTPTSPSASPSPTPPPSPSDSSSPSADAMAPPRA